MIVNSGVRTISGINAKPIKLAGNFFGSKQIPTEIYLGEARTDSAGRLVVLAGRGYSHSIADKDKPYPLIMTDFDSSDWVDDTSDGWVNVKVVHSELPDGQYVFVSSSFKINLISNLSMQPLYKARVIGTTPKFANGIYAPTTLFDLMEDVYERKGRANAGESYEIGEVEWYRDIWSLLQRPALLSWVNGQANGGHGRSFRCKTSLTFSNH